MKQRTFTVACKEFFGFHEGQSLSQFAAELKQLTEKDRADLTEMFKSIGYEIVKS